MRQAREGVRAFSQFIGSEVHRSGGPKVGGSNPLSPTDETAGQGRSSVFWTRVLHLIAQNAHHQTDTGLLGRHRGLIPRALTTQVDTLDRFL